MPGYQNPCVKGLVLSMALFFLLAACWNGNLPDGEGDTPEGQAEAPVFSPGEGTYSFDIEVSLTTGTPDAVLYYTLDGSAPDNTSPIYRDPIPVAGNGTQAVIQAIAAKTGLLDSPVSRGEYVINYSRVSTPGFDPAPGTVNPGDTVQFTCLTENVTWHYTLDGTDPTAESPSASSVIITAPSEIRVMAVKEGMLSSTVATGTYTVPLPEPALDTPGGTVAYGTVVGFTCAEAGVSFFYTLDGTDPNSSSLSGGSWTVDQPASLRVKAVKDGWADSSSASAEYTPRIPAPALSPSGGAVNNGTTVAFSSAVAGVTFRYTTDGTTPTGSSTGGASLQLYQSPVTVTVKAFKTGWAESSAAAGTYTINPPGTPTDFYVSLPVHSYDYFRTPEPGWKYTISSSWLGTYASRYELEVSVAGTWRSVEDEIFNHNYSNYARYWDSGSQLWIPEKPAAYSFRLRAVNSGGVSAWVETTAWMEMGTPGLVGYSWTVVSPNRITVRIWELSEAVQEYDIEYRKENDSQWSWAGTALLSQKVLDPGSGAYYIPFTHTVDSLPGLSNRFLYRVRAFRQGAGGVFYYSPWSNEVIMP